MSVPTPFHPRTSALCRSYLWKDWAGYHAVRSYDTYHEREYFAVRHAAGLLDVTPLYKYDVAGRDAAAFLSYVMVRDISSLEIGQVVYCCWSDEHGKLLDDGTIFRFEETRFWVTSTEPNLAWFTSHARGFDVTIEDSTHRIAALSVQGPTSRTLLAAVAGSEIETLGYFRHRRGKIDGVDVTISRTGYTGDLGYEIWVENANALRVWDAVTVAGAPHGLLPIGLDALDMTRVEAGFILSGVDYFRANRCLIEERKSSPYEVGLGWLVKLDRAPFVGQPALREEKKRGPRRRLVGLEMAWDELEALFAAHRLPPEVPNLAWRSAVPVYDRRGRQVGQATSGSWSPILKKNLSLATVAAGEAAIGNELRMEVTVEYVRRTASVRVVKKPFFDPPRKKS